MPGEILFYLEMWFAVCCNIVKTASVRSERTPKWSVVPGRRGRACLGWDPGLAAEMSEGLIRRIVVGNRL